MSVRCRRRISFILAIISLGRHFQNSTLTRQRGVEDLITANKQFDYFSAGYVNKYQSEDVFFVLWNTGNRENRVQLLVSAEGTTHFDPARFTALGPTGCRWLNSLEINLPEREAHCLSPSSDWVRNGWSYTFIYLLRGVGRMRRGGFCKPNAQLLVRSGLWKVVIMWSISLITTTD